MPNPVEFYELVARKFAVEAGMAAEWVNDAHWATVGTSREWVLRRFLSDYLPRRFACGSGFIATGDGGLSRQCDIIIYDASVLEPLFVDDSFVVVRADAVKVVIEAKSTVDRAEFVDALDSIRRAKCLHPAIRGAIFGLQGPAQAGTIGEWLATVSHSGVAAPVAHHVALSPEHLVDFVHLASGIQMETIGVQDTAAAAVQARTFAPPSGHALLYFWDWILRMCLRGTEQTSTYLLNYLGIEDAQMDRIAIYENHFEGNDA